MIRCPAGKSHPLRVPPVADRPKPTPLEKPRSASVNRCTGTSLANRPVRVACDTFRLNPAPRSGRRPRGQCRYIAGAGLGFCEGSVAFKQTPLLVVNLFLLLNLKVNLPVLLIMDH